MASITALAMEEPKQVYLSTEIRNLLESHIEFLRKHPTTTFFGLEPHLIYKYRGDFYGLMIQANVPINYHWLMLRINGYTSPTNIDENRLYFIQPNFTFVEQIINAYRASKNVN